MSISPFAATCAIALAASLCLALPAGATTLDFDGLPDAPGADGFGTLADANGGSSTLAGIAFDSAANAEWDIVGNAFVAYQDTFAASHSGTYALTGNAFVGSVTDAFGNEDDFTGLAIGTTQRLTQLWVGFDDNGFGSNDAQSLTITALTASGDVSTSVALTGTTLSLFDTSATFGGLAGITGYRFTTVASNDLYAAAGQAYVVADDLTFASATAAVPEPPVVVLIGFGLAALAFDWARRRLYAAFATGHPASAIPRVHATSPSNRLERITMSTSQSRPHPLRRIGAPALLAAATTLLGAGPAAAVGPTPVTVVNGPLATMSAPTTPFMAVVYMNISAGSNTGDADGNFSGAQSVAVPAGKRLVVQSMSAYRYGGVPSGSSLQVYVDAYTNGQIGAWAMPPIVAVGGQYPGGSLAMTYYVDGGTRFLVNVYRNATTSDENVQFNLSGYLVDAP